MKRKPHGYWTYERCKEEALKYNLRSHFNSGEGKGAYTTATKEGWLDQICSHMEYNPQKPSGYWTYERCKEEALKYKTRTEFSKNCGSAYSNTIKNEWHELLEHMVYTQKPTGYWTYEQCKEEALKYKTRTEFFKKCGSGYQIASRKGWLEKICKHMKTSINGYYIIYAYEFPDNCVYIGLTRRRRKRFLRHKKDEKSIAYQHTIKSGLKPKYKILWGDGKKVYNADIAKEKEEYYLQQYLEEGWSKLNRVKTGSIGGNIVKWTYNACKEEALKYNTRNEFRKGSPGAYNATLKNKWGVCLHMVYKQKPKKYWCDYNRCKEESKKYNNRTSFKESSAYRHSLKNGWIDEFFPNKKRV